MTKVSLPHLALPRVAAAAAVLAALALPRPVPARAWWVGGVVVPPVYVAPPVVVAPPVIVPPPPPAVVYGPRPVARWVPGHYNWRGFWVPGHWV